MDIKNRLSEVPLATITPEERGLIEELERRLGDRYYLIAFEKDLRP
ncbi:MAG: hypothetical protein QHH02_08580 [Syntrophomonadaceae bacterium]|nr:hypothetical protein [Syntrophomonadaceae bacterium]